jgi:hypothetical protein
LDGLIGGIAVSETEYMTTTSLHKGTLLTQVFYSNAVEVVKQGQYVFNTFWHKAIPAKQRIREIEEGAKREFIETILAPNYFWLLTLSLVSVFDFKYFITTIIVIALKFPSFLWPIRNNPTAIGNRIMP